MKEPIKILFDENFGEPLVNDLAAFFHSCRDPVEFRHVFKFAKPGDKDEIWIPKIAPGGWIVVSSDRGKQCGGQKLPKLCHENKITHFVYSATLHNAGNFEKQRAIVSTWPQIVAASRRDRGIRFSMRYFGNQKRIVLFECAAGTFTAIPTGSQRLAFEKPKKRKPIVRERLAPPEAIPIPDPEALFPGFKDEPKAATGEAETDRSQS